MDITQIIQAMKTSQHPEQFLNGLMGQTNNPMSANLFSLIRNGNIAEAQRLAQNVCKEQGRDFNAEFEKFKKTFGL